MKSCMHRVFDKTLITAFVNMGCGRNHHKIKGVAVFKLNAAALILCFIILHAWYVALLIDKFL